LDTVYTDYDDLSRLHFDQFIDPASARDEAARYFSYNLDQAFDSCRIDPPDEHLGIDE
jgi:hypothetical protein